MDFKMMYCKRHKGSLQCRSEIVSGELQFIRFYASQCQQCTQVKIDKDAYDTILNNKKLTQEEFDDLLELMKYVYDNLTQKEKFFLVVSAIMEMMRLHINIRRGVAIQSDDVVVFFDTTQVSIVNLKRIYSDTI